jgi:hypothetical protein
MSHEVLGRPKQHFDAYVVFRVLVSYKTFSYKVDFYSYNASTWLYAMCDIPALPTKHL